MALREEAKIIDERCFYIVSAMNGKVLDVHKADVKAGAQVVMQTKKATRELSQLWYMDGGIIKSKLNNFAMEVHENKDKVHLVPFNGDARQQWIVQGNKIVNKMFCNECLDIKRGKKRDDADVIATPYEGKEHQHWSCEYVGL